MLSVILGNSILTEGPITVFFCNFFPHVSLPQQIEVAQLNVFMFLWDKRSPLKASSFVLGFIVLQHFINGLFKRVIISYEKSITKVVALIKLIMNGVNDLNCASVPSSTQFDSGYPKICQTARRVAKNSTSRPS